jgi:hypothetical protein
VRRTNNDRALLVLVLVLLERGGPPGGCAPKRGNSGIGAETKQATSRTNAGATWAGRSPRATGREAALEAAVKATRRRTVKATLKATRTADATVSQTERSLTVTVIAAELQLAPNSADSCRLGPRQDGAGHSSQNDQSLETVCR